MVYALKSFSRQDHSDELIDTDLKDNIEVVLELYHNQIKQGCEVVRDYNSLPPIPCYPDELGQVWTNLIHNALQAMDHQGTLTIGIDQNELEAIVSVSDTGKGIPEEIREKIFQPFFTTQPAGEGIGLGLDIVKKIIEKHQGKISVESEEGKGTTFCVYLPKNPVTDRQKIQ